MHGSLDCGSSCRPIDVFLDLASPDTRVFDGGAFEGDGAIVVVVIAGKLEPVMQDRRTFLSVKYFLLSATRTPLKVATIVYETNSYLAKVWNPI